MSDFKPWGPTETETWFAEQTFQRSYEKSVIDRLNDLPKDLFEITQYGTLSIDPNRYPLFCVTTKKWNKDNPSVIITGGVHGYEPSGIISVFRFLEEEAADYADQINIVAYPCVSPLAYEINHRWNQKAEDPNRHFFEGGTAEEAINLMHSVESLHERFGVERFTVAIDLHETNQRDIGLRRDRNKRDGKDPALADPHIPDGFYLILNSGEDMALGHKIIEAVGTITPICGDEKILGYTSNKGVLVINDVPGLCQAFISAHAAIAMTTEIYPDKAPAREAENGQLAVVRTAIRHVLAI